MSPSLSRIAWHRYRTQTPEGSCLFTRAQDRPTVLISSPRFVLLAGTSSVLGQTARLRSTKGPACPVGVSLHLFPIPDSSLTFLPAPYVAGSAALIIQVRGKTNKSASAIKDLLESTASPIASNLTGTKPLQTLILAGAGLIQVDRAIDTTTVVSPGHLVLNDTAHFQPK